MEIHLSKLKSIAQSIPILSISVVLFIAGTVESGFSRIFFFGVGSFLLLICFTLYHRMLKIGTKPHMEITPKGLVLPLNCDIPIE